MRQLAWLNWVCCYLFMDLLAFNFVFSMWLAWSVRISNFIVLTYSWVAFDVCFESLSICHMRQRPVEQSEQRVQPNPISNQRILVSTTSTVLKTSLYNVYQLILSFSKMFSLFWYNSVSTVQLFICPNWVLFRFVKKLIYKPK